jgi:HEAT repeat protein/outer membrane protein assembly factor BamB
MRSIALLNCAAVAAVIGRGRPIVVFIAIILACLALPACQTPETRFHRWYALHELREPLKQLPKHKIDLVTLKYSHSFAKQVNNQEKVGIVALPDQRHVLVASETGWQMVNLKSGNVLWKRDSDGKDDGIGLEAGSIVQYSYVRSGRTVRHIDLATGNQSDFLKLAPHQTCSRFLGTLADGRVVIMTGALAPLDRKSTLSKIAKTSTMVVHVGKLAQKSDGDIRLTSFSSEGLVEPFGVSPEGLLYVGVWRDDGSSTLIAYDLNTHRTRWTQEYAGFLSGIKLSNGRLYAALQSVAGQNIVEVVEHIYYVRFLGGVIGGLHAGQMDVLNHKTGRLEYSVGQLGSEKSAIAWYGGTKSIDIYAIGNGFMGIDVRTGKKLWVSNVFGLISQVHADIDTRCGHLTLINNVLTSGVRCDLKTGRQVAVIQLNHSSGNRTNNVTLARVGKVWVSNLRAQVFVETKEELPLTVYIPEAEETSVFTGKNAGTYSPDPDDAVVALIKALQHDKVEYRRAAAAKLVHPSGVFTEDLAPAVPHLIKALDDSDPSVRWLSASALARIGVFAKQSIPALSRKLKQKQKIEFLRFEDEVVQGQTVQDIYDLEFAHAIAIIDPTSKQALHAAAVLKTLCLHKEHSIRSGATAGLMNIPATVEFAINVLKRELAHKDAKIRERACHNIVRIAELENQQHPQRLTPLLKDLSQLLLNDSVKDVRITAAMAIGSMGKLAKPVEPALRKALASPDRHIHNYAFTALSHIGFKKDDLPLLIRGIKALPFNVRSRASKAIVAIGKPAVPDLVKLLATDDMYSRETVVITLGKIGPDAKAALMLLQKIAKSDIEPDIRKAAVEAIRKIQR